MPRMLSRLEGRLFTENGCLFLVVKVDETTATARVSGRVDGRVAVAERPLADVAKQIAASTGVILDNLNAPDNTRRVAQQDDGWYFTAREGRIGPFRTRKQAEDGLAGYVLSIQTAQPPSPAVEEARGPAPARRRRREQAAA